MHVMGAHSDVVPSSGRCVLQNGSLLFATPITQEQLLGQGGSVLFGIRPFHGQGSYELDSGTNIQYAFDSVSWTGGLGDITVQTFEGIHLAGFVRLIGASTNIQPPEPTIDLLGSWSCAVITSQ
jgi:hypothetical protein